MSDHLFPRFHVRPARGYLNDPNGPIVIDGLLHLYYQYRNTVDPESPVLWGHVTSRDLVRWDYHRPALAPHPWLGDRDGCWSGNTILDGTGRVRAFYSGCLEGEQLQRTLTAVSDDGGWSFGSPREIVPLPGLYEGIRTLRDPFVWRHGPSWRMVLGVGTLDGRAGIRLYESADLERWSYLGLMARLARTRTEAWDSGVMWECPQVMTVDDDLVTVVGTWSPTEGVMQVLSFATPDDGGADDDGSDELDPGTLHLVDHGPNFYAASVLVRPGEAPLLWGWATEGRAPDWCREAGWSGMLTLPRLITMRPDGGLASAPVPAMTSLRTEARGREVIDGLDRVAAQFEFLLRPDPAADGCVVVTVGFGHQEFLTIRVDYGAGSVAIDRGRASRDPRAASGTCLVDGIDVRGGGEIRGFVDGSILELFLPGGRVATVRFYPTSPPPWRIELDRPHAARLRVWELAR